MFLQDLNINFKKTDGAKERSENSLVRSFEEDIFEGDMRNQLSQVVVI